MDRMDSDVRELFELLKKSLHMPYIGEKISQLEHALQCGDLACNARADEEMVLAAFFHDIGHLCVDDSAARMGEFGIENHEGIGAEYLSRIGFSKRVCDLVRGHVNAKRYLAYKNQNYAKNLSPASLATLGFQGGPMSAEEASGFESSPLMKNILQLRAWDELGKIVGKQTSPLSFFEEMARRHLSRNFRPEPHL